MTWFMKPLTIVYNLAWRVEQVGEGERLVPPSGMPGGSDGQPADSLSVQPAGAGPKPKPKLTHAESFHHRAIMIPP